MCDPGARSRGSRSSWVRMSPGGGRIRLRLCRSGGSRGAPRDRQPGRSRSAGGWDAEDQDIGRPLMISGSGRSSRSFMTRTAARQLWRSRSHATRGCCSSNTPSGIRRWRSRTAGCWRRSAAGRFSTQVRVLRAHCLNAVEKGVQGELFRFIRPRHGPRVPIDALTALSMAHSVAVAESLKEPEVPRDTWLMF